MRSTLFIWGLLFLVWCGLSACSKGTIHGKVFLDENNNGVIESNEIGAPFMKIQVFKDKKIIAKGITRQDGSFSLTTKGGTYVFKVDLSGYDYDLAMRQANWQAMTVKAEDDEDAGGFGDGGEFKVIETGSDDGSTGDGTTATKDETDKTKKDDTADKENDSGDTNDAQKENDVPDGWTSEGYRIYVKRGETKVAEIGVGIDSEGALEREPDAAKKTCIFGSPCKISVSRLSGCTVDVSLFDGANVPSQSGIAFNASLGIATIEEQGSNYSTHAMKATVTSSTSNSLQPTLSLAELSFIAPSTLPDKSLEYIARPVMWCGETKYQLKERKIAFIRDIVPKVRLSVISNTKTKITLVSDGDSPIEEGEVVVEFVTDNKPVNVTNAGGCDNLGQAVLCTVSESIVKGVNQGEKSWDIITSIPESSENDTTITISAKFHSRYFETPVEALAPAMRFFLGQEEVEAP